MPVSETQSTFEWGARQMDRAIMLINDVTMTLDARAEAESYSDVYGDIANGVREMTQDVLPELRGFRDSLTQNARSLRRRVIRLAAVRPDLRHHLLRALRGS